jgi:hypothetical protein
MTEETEDTDETKTEGDEARAKGDDKAEAGAQGDKAEGDDRAEAGTEGDKADKDPPLPEAEQDKLEHLDDEIGQARQHLKELTHEGEETFIEDGGPADEAETDNTIAPPG